VLDDPAILPQAPCGAWWRRAPAVVTDMDVRAIGEAAVALGAGRRALGEAIDPGVGFHITAKPGDVVEPGPAARHVYAATARRRTRPCARCSPPCASVRSPATALPLIVDRIAPAT
jgi:thymidine phosphorylase